MKKFQIESPFELKPGDQPQAIDELCRGLEESRQRNQVLPRRYGSKQNLCNSGKITERCQRPAPDHGVPNVLWQASTLCSEMKEFFPHNQVEYSSLYYDYYQPEAYVPKNRHFISKRLAINEQIDRIKATRQPAVFGKTATLSSSLPVFLYLRFGDVASYSAMT